MSVYTSFEMIADCRAGKPAGWIHVACHFVPALRWLLARYGQGEAELRALLVSLRADIQRYQPMPQREFVAQLRPRPASAPAPFELEVLTSAFDGLSLLERQNVWLDTMGYGTEEAARLLRQTAETAAQARDKAAGFLRARLDSWSRTMLREHGPALGEAARAAVPAEPIPFRDFLDFIDGRMSWQSRTGFEHKLGESLYEIDHFCRAREADAAVAETSPLTAAEAQPYLDLLGVALPKPPLWKRILG